MIVGRRELWRGARIRRLFAALPKRNRGSDRSGVQNATVLRDVDAEIADAQAQLAELERLRDVVTERLADLNRLRASASADRRAVSGAELSAASKLELFRDLFRGRQDVFAVRWENRAKGRSGYSPRCDNEWKPGVCHKPKVRCGSCTSQAFVSLGDRELLAHLRGRVVIGIYPLLPDDTCQMLAIDLDGTSWRADARAIRETCRSLDLEPTIERSRSGNGGHVWLFFTHSVAAADARRLGFYILTETMARGAALSVASYDPLFPSQDVLPNGGFGNLIALPLQREARKFGNTARTRVMTLSRSASDAIALGVAATSASATGWSRATCSRHAVHPGRCS
jgi:hypothetical protein